jgi:phage terminase large subunit-like protein
VIITQTPAGDIKIIKNKNKQHQKVDGIVAAVMALGQYLDYKGSEPKGGKSYTVVGLDF